MKNLFISTMFAAAAWLIGVYLYHSVHDVALPNALLDQRDTVLEKHLRSALERLKIGLEWLKHRDVPWDEIAASLSFHIRGGQMLIDSIRAVSQEGASLGHKMLERSHQLYESGVPIFKALNMVSGGQGELAMISSALEIGSITGGDLAALLWRISETFRKRRLLHGEINAKLSESKMTAILLSSLPWLIGFLTFKADPKRFAMLLTDAQGKFLLSISFLLWAFGVIIIVFCLKSISVPKVGYNRASRRKPEVN
ncbi:MAG TPA: type II secretion system F family protein [Bacillota bacterium]|nr:type II secretion system F family protein [Bacillota bacterium]HOL11301.1 type II secretion system F family protein [Bacillota bacterium]HPP60213.1 type II secretion system F family protein [Bacillota bacterium]